ncbi:hypothetical protein P4B35_05285 [Pontiellaceae bacterium B12227]|nr:hypothetical protein [Pontiellaceae bacterium B12227]
MPYSMNKQNGVRGLYLALTALLFGCSTPMQTPEPVIDQDAAMEFLEPGLRPEVLLFPDYLMMEGFELHQHGRVPGAELVGAGMRSKMSLAVIHGRLLDILDSNGWKTTKLEIEGKSFRMLAAHGLEHIEIRGVQGTGPTEVFMLYRPEPVFDDLTEE